MGARGGVLRRGLLLAGLLLAAAVVPARAAERLTVEVSGIEEAEARDNLLAALAPSPGIEIDGKVNRPWLEYYRRRAPQLAVEALRPFGYYHAGADTQLAVLDGEIFRLTVNVRPGAPVRITALDLRVSGPGAGQKALAGLVRAFPLEEGGILRQDLYERAKEELRDSAVALGYLDAAFPRHAIVIDPELDQARVELTLETGERYLFGPARLDGGDAYPRDFLARYLAFTPGEPFSQDLLGQTQLNFLNSDRFREAVIAPHPEEVEELRVPVDVRLTPSRQIRLRPGIGYGTDTGARASVNFRHLNAFGLGHEFSAEFKAAERQQSFLIGYILPSLTDLNSQLALTGGYDAEETDSYDSRKIFLEGRQTRALPRGRLLAGYLRLLREDYTIGGEDARETLFLPGAEYTQRRYDDPRQPRKGYLYRLELRGTHRALGSAANLLQAIGDGRLLRPLPAGFSLLLRAQAASTWQDREFDAIPPSLRFFAGGDQSVRGYAWQSLGPKDDKGKVIGGKHLLVGSVELEHPLGGNWGVALFYDAGNAFDSFSDYELAQGAGLGVRYYTPVGPLRIDLARQVGVSDPSFRLHLSIGLTW